MNRPRISAMTIVFLAAFASTAAAHSDVFLADVAGQVAIGGANELETVDENFDLTTKVFAGVMVPGFPPFDPHDYGRNEPGFVALASGDVLTPPGAAALPASADASLAFAAFTVSGQTDTLFYWNGSGVVDFEPVSVAQPGVLMTLDPNPFGTTGAGGSLHEHAAFELDNGAAGVPADGIYLVSPTASVAGLADSKPFFMVWLVDQLIADDDTAEELEEVLETDNPVLFDKNFAFVHEAFDYVHDNLVVPEPCTGVSAVIGLVGIGAITSRRRSG